MSGFSHHVNAVVQSWRYRNPFALLTLEVPKLFKFSLSLPAKSQKQKKLNMLEGMDQTKEVVLFLSGRPETEMSCLMSLADRLPQHYIVWSYVDI